MSMETASRTDAVAAPDRWWPSPFGENDVNWISEVISGTTQLGTHLDALSHLQVGDRGYNGLRVSDIAAPGGVRLLGIETVPQIITRGHLVDVSAERLGPGDVISTDAVAALEPRPGDAVLFHTGWGRHWDDPPT